MSYLTEDPSYLLIGLGVAAACCLVALKVTQQGKFLVWAGALAAVALACFGFEHFYVTDAERVEAVVYDLAKAVEASDVERIKSHLDDKVSLTRRGRTTDGSLTLALVLPMLKQARFDFVRVGQLSAATGSQTRRGSAEFKVTATGTFQQGGGEVPIPPTVSEWSLGLGEKSPGVWKVNRVTAIRLPGDVANVLFSR